MKKNDGSVLRSCWGKQFEDLESCWMWYLRLQYGHFLPGFNSGISSSFYRTCLCKGCIESFEINVHFGYDLFFFFRARSWGRWEELQLWDQQIQSWRFRAVSLFLIPDPCQIVICVIPFLLPLCVFSWLEYSLPSGNDLLFIGLKVEEEFLYGGGLRKHSRKNVRA